jgi:hypothetical protein
LHSYDPGVSATLGFWIAAIPTGSGRANLDAGAAELHARNICSVFDIFTVANSLTPTRPMGNPVSAEIEALDLVWSGVTRSVLGFSDPVNQFAGDFFESSASIQVTVHTDPSTGHGFRFVSRQQRQSTLLSLGVNTTACSSNKLTGGSCHKGTARFSFPPKIRRANRHHAQTPVRLKPILYGVFLQPCLFEENPRGCEEQVRG